jgi:hypothetical protein
MEEPENLGNLCNYGAEFNNSEGSCFPDALLTLLLFMDDAKSCFQRNLYHYSDELINPVARIPMLPEELKYIKHMLRTFSNKWKNRFEPFEIRRAHSGILGTHMNTAVDSYNRNLPECYEFPRVATNNISLYIQRIFYLIKKSFCPNMNIYTKQLEPITMINNQIQDISPPIIDDLGIFLSCIIYVNTVPGNSREFGEPRQNGAHALSAFICEENYYFYDDNERKKILINRDIFNGIKNHRFFYGNVRGALCFFEIDTDLNPKANGEILSKIRRIHYIDSMVNFNISGSSAFDGTIREYIKVYIPSHKILFYRLIGANPQDFNEFEQATWDSFDGFFPSAARQDSEDGDGYFDEYRDGDGDGAAQGGGKYNYRKYLKYKRKNN